MFNVSKTSRFQDARLLNLKFPRLQHSNVIRFQQFNKFKVFQFSRLSRVSKLQDFRYLQKLIYFRFYEFNMPIILRLQHFQDLTNVKIRHFSHLWFKVETYPERNLAMLQISKVLKSCNLRPF